MSTLSLVPCELGGIVVESAIYGMFLVMFIACLYCLISKRHAQGGSSSGPVNKTMLSAALILFISITTHWILDITRLFQAFVTENPDPLAYYANLSIPINVIKTGLYVFECIVADIIMCYRLWIILERKSLICIFPLCTTFAFLVTGIGITYQFTRLKPGEQVFLSVCSRWITSAFTCTLVYVALFVILTVPLNTKSTLLSAVTTVHRTNIYCTSIISYKIWSVNRAFEGSAGRSNTAVVGARQLHVAGVCADRELNIKRVIVIVVESAAIYTSCSLVTLVSYLSNSNIQFPGLDSTSPVVGFVFCLIIVRVSLGFDHKSTMSTPQRNLRGWAPGGIARTPVQISSHDEEYGMNHVNICISRHIETDSDENSLKKTGEGRSVIP